MSVTALPARPWAAFLICPRERCERCRQVNELQAAYANGASAARSDVATIYWLLARLRRDDALGLRRAGHRAARIVMGSAPLWPRHDRPVLRPGPRADDPPRAGRWNLAPGF